MSDIELYACGDCYMWIVNAHLNENWTEGQGETFVRVFNNSTEGYRIYAGTERDPFGTHQCDTCNSHLGGARYQVWGEKELDAKR